jgi:hypothetical protein
MSRKCTGPCGRDLPDEGRSICRTCRARRDAAKKRGSSVDNIVEAIRAGGPELFAFGTPIQRASAEALLACGDIVSAAASVQLEPGVFRAHLSELARRAATRGWSPGHDMTKRVPDGYGVKGVSSYYGKDGELRGQWVKTKRDEEQRLALLLGAMTTVAETWQGKADPITPPADMLDEDLLAVYPMGDPHLGMYSWAPETGNNFDLQIAERELFGAVDHLVELAPSARYALIACVGDLFHADNRGSTTTGGTPVDSDGRWPKVLSTGVRLMRRNIDRALMKHEIVDVIIEIGNHDWHTAIMLAICLAQFYEREPRVRINTSPAKAHWYRFGKVLIGVTHGDTMKLADLGEIMAADRPQDWGETLYRYWLTGHIHHDTRKELRGCVAESFRTLAPADAWHAGQGYRSGRDMKMIVMHREHGELYRHTVGIRQIHSKQGPTT